jgi:hypothetical protein
VEKLIAFVGLFNLDQSQVKAIAFFASLSFEAKFVFAQIYVEDKVAIFN